MANYGDIALNLPPDWERARQHDPNYALMTVGHQNGVSDAYLIDEPDKRYQFAWVLRTFKGVPNEEVDINRTKGYSFVKKGEWEKNANLWEWDAEGFLTCKGQSLMARPAELFLADMAARKRQRDQVMGGRNKEEERIAEMAARAGIEVTGSDEGRPVQRRKGMRG